MKSVGFECLTQGWRHCGSYLLINPFGRQLQLHVSGSIQQRERKHDGLHLFDGKHEGRQIESWSQDIADAASALDGTRMDCSAAMSL